MKVTLLTGRSDENYCQHKIEMIPFGPFFEQPMTDFPHLTEGRNDCRPFL
jgi:hypothetical protein